MRVLAVDDDEAFVFGLRALLRREGCDVTGATSGREGMALSAASAWDAVLLDLGLPDVSGLEVLRALSAGGRRAPVIVLSGRDEARVAVEALQLGATHYLTKPPTREALAQVIAELRAQARVQERLEVASRDGRSTPEVALGDSPVWRAVLDDLRRAAASPRTPVLLTGESGTGKEVAASLIHAWSPRASRPFVSVNASCFSPSLLESELFGHEAGAFTGAAGVRRGLLELAAGGTLFLDEIGELPLDLQPKLLRVLDGCSFRRVGGERSISTDVRIVSATNRRLEEAVRAGRFRLDLYHRLRVLEVGLPPLRERGADSELIARYFLSKLGAELGKPGVQVAPEAWRAIRAYPWPGNVRELRNVVERAVVLCTGDLVVLRDLPPEMHAPSAPALPARSRQAPTLALDDVVREHVLRVYGECGGNVARAARGLGIGRATLRRKLREYGITSEDPAPRRRA